MTLVSEAEVQAKALLKAIEEDGLADLETQQQVCDCHPYRHHMKLSLDEYYNAKADARQFYADQFGGNY